MQPGRTGWIAAIAILGCALGAGGAPAPPTAVRWSAEIGTKGEWLSVADDGTTVVWGGWRPGHARLLDGATGRVRWSYRSRGDRIRAADISATGDRVALEDSRTLRPQTELSEERLLMLTGGGQVLWQRAVRGGAQLSPSGDHLLTHDPENGAGLTVYRGSDGRLLWQILPGRALEAALFSPDGGHVLLRDSRSAALFTVDGELVWWLDFPDGVGSASTSADATLSAVLTQGTRVNVTLVDRRGRVSGLELLRFPEFQLRPPFLNWDGVAVDATGDLVVLDGVGPGGPQLRALNPSADPVWELIPGFDRGTSTYLEPLSPGLLVLAAPSRDGVAFHFIDGVGSLRETVRVATPGPPFWRASRNGRYISVIAGSRVQSLAVPTALAKSPAPLRRDVARRADGVRWAWVSLARAFSNDAWRITKHGRMEELIAESREGRRVSVRVGSVNAAVDGKPVVLPAAPRRVGKRVEVPSTLLNIVAAGGDHAR